MPKKLWNLRNILNLNESLLKKNEHDNVGNWTVVLPNGDKITEEYGTKLNGKTIYQ